MANRPRSSNPKAVTSRRRRPRSCSRGVGIGFRPPKKLGELCRGRCVDNIRKRWFGSEGVLQHLPYSMRGFRRKFAPDGTDDRCQEFELCLKCQGADLLHDDHHRVLGLTNGRGWESHVESPERWPPVSGPYGGTRFHCEVGPEKSWNLDAQGRKQVLNSGETHSVRAQTRGMLWLRHLF